METVTIVQGLEGIDDFFCDARKKLMQQMNKEKFEAMKFGGIVPSQSDSVSSREKTVNAKPKRATAQSKRRAGSR